MGRLKLGRTNSLDPLHTTLPGTHAGIREGTADLLISPGGDGPAVEGSIFAGLAGFWVMGEASGLWGRHEHSVPLQPLLRGVLDFAGAAVGPVGAVLLMPQT